MRPLRKETPAAGARGPAGRAHPAGRSEKPAPGRDRECRARAREDKVSGLFAAHASAPAAFGAGQSGHGLFRVPWC